MRIIGLLISACAIAACTAPCENSAKLYDPGLVNNQDYLERPFRNGDGWLLMSPALLQGVFDAGCSANVYDEPCDVLDSYDWEVKLAVDETTIAFVHKRREEILRTEQYLYAFSCGTRFRRWQCTTEPNE